VTSPNLDSEHLRLLSIFHYVVAGIATLFSLFALIYLAMGLAIVFGRLDPASKNPPPPLVGWFFVLFAIAWIVSGLTFAASVAYAGRFLEQRRRYLYCLVIAGVECMFAPFGTILGVFTIFVLVRPSVKEAFKGGTASTG
jgi:hypothetical protein